MHVLVVVWIYELCDVLFYSTKPSPSVLCQADHSVSGAVDCLYSTYECSGTCVDWATVY